MTKKVVNRKDQTDIIENSIVVINFLKKLRTQGTRYTYKSQIKKYFLFLNTNPDDYINNKKTCKEYKDDIENFAIYLRDDLKLSPNGQGGSLTCVKVFLRRNDIEINRGFWDDLWNGIVSKRRTVTRDKIPTQKELKRILQHSELKGRALFLMMSSSGMRIGEAVKITKDDVDFKTNPVKIVMPAEITKTKIRDVTTFISNEARDAIIEWCVTKSRHIDDNGEEHLMTPRDYYIKTAIAKCNIPNRKPVDDDRIFPFSSVNARRIWNRLIRDAGLNDRDKNSGYHKIHPHTLRKFFRTQLGFVPDVGQDAIESMIGHESPYGYRRLDEQPNELAKLYELGVHKLLIFEVPAEPSEELQRQQEEITNLKKQIDLMNKALKDITDGMDKQVGEHIKNKEAYKEYQKSIPPSETRPMPDQIKKEIERAGSLKKWSKKKLSDHKAKTKDGLA